MKRFIFVAAAAFAFSQSLFSQASDPVAFLINGEEVTKSEFEYIYRKNNSSTALEKKTLQEYVDLFVNFKLKVAQAKDLWYDRAKTFKREYEIYENQLTFPYLRDSLLEDRLLHEAYDRSAYNVNVSHILISVDEQADDTSAAYAKISDIYAQLTKGASFESLAVANSDCPSKKDGGSIGVIAPFSTVYPFENVAYNTPVGSVSKPFRTRFGYHILRVNEKQLIVKDLKFSQILLPVNDPKSEKLANKICAQLNKGKLKFADAAKKYSMDDKSRAKGGSMGYISEFPFLDPAFVHRLKSIGKVGTYEWFKSSVGLHIVTVDEIISNATYEEMLPSLKAKLAKSDRGENSVNDLIARLKRDNNLVVYNQNLNAFYEYTMLGDSEATKEKRDSMRRVMNDPLFVYKGNVYSQKEFHTPYIKALNSTYRNVTTRDVAQHWVDSTFNDFINRFVWDTELDRLKKENPEYRHLLNEYRDGLLLFEISSKKVWTKAAKDYQGMERYFEENKSKYTWDAPRYKGAVVKCADKATLDKVNHFVANYVPSSSAKVKGKKKVQPQPIPYDSINVILDREFNKNGAVKVKVNKGVYTKGMNADVDALAFDKKEAASAENDFPYVTCVGKLISAPENASDIKGPLTADYQNYLEEKWVEELHNKYPVVKYQAVINSIEE